MILTKIILHHDSKLTDAAEAWEGMLTDLQVLAAASDGHFGADERFLLAFQGQLLQRPEAVERRVSRIQMGLEDKGFEAVASEKLGELDGLWQALPQGLRPQVAEMVLLYLMELLKADRVISEKERAFIVDGVAPRLGLSPQAALDRVRKGEGELDRSQKSGRLILATHVMLVDHDDYPPPDEVDIQFPGALGKIFELVEGSKLGSPAAVGWFMGRFGGIEFLSHVDKWGQNLVSWVKEERILIEQQGVEGRLESLSAQVTPEDGQAIVNDVIGYLTVLEVISGKQRRFLRERILPALGVKVEELDEVATQVRRVNPKLYDKLIGEKRWWQFWQ